MRFSASRLGLWMTCPLAAHYRYDEELPSQPNGKTIFGTVIHTAIAQYNTTLDLDRAIATFRRDWERRSSEAVWWPKGTNYPSLRTKGVQILRALVDTYRFQDRVVLGCEVPFLVPFGDHELTGFIDTLETQRSGTGAELLKVVDYKTASGNPTAAELALDIQFTVYLWAVSQRELWVGTKGHSDGLDNGEWLWETIGRDMPKRGIYHNVWAGRQLDVGPRTDADFARLYRLCDEIARASAADIYVPKIGSHCDHCDYAEPCLMEIPATLAAARDEDDDERWI